MADVRKQVVTGVVPPQLDEAVIRVAWPSVAAFPAVAGLGRVLTRTIVGAPLAWLLMAPFYFRKVLPFLARRYTLTNRRLMIQAGLKPTPAEEVPLAEIDEVRIVEDSNSGFYRAATLEILSQGKVVLRLPGVPGYQAFRYAVINACKAWVPGKANAPIVPASASKPS
jgi:hypothetical protein